MLELLNADEVIEKAQALEPLPAAASRLANLVSQPEPELDEIVDVISYDQGLTARLLRFANSASSGTRHPISTVRAAVIRMGFGVVLSVTMAPEARGRLRSALPAYRMAEGDLWLHSVAAAVTAEHLTDALAVNAPPETFTAALLHDVGKPIMAGCIDQEALHFLDRAETEGGRSRRDAETELLGLHHGELGGLIAQHWRLPQSIVEGIVFHHDPSEGAGPVADLVHAANALAKVVGRGPLEQCEVPVDDLLADVEAACSTRIGLDGERLAAIVAAASARLPDVMALYGV